MHQLPNKDLDPAVKRLDLAIISHRQWVRALMKSLVCKMQHADTDMSPDAHFICEFGHWYYNESPESLRHNETFKNIESLHKDMHQIAAKMLSTRDTEFSISVQDFDEFYSQLDLFVKEVDKLKTFMQKLLYNRDPLTDAYSRATLDEELYHLQQKVVEEEAKACLVMMDIDHFKLVNDNYGHAFGDTVLRSMSLFIQKHLRSFDKFFRYGGEEFVLSLTNTDIGAAVVLAERIRQELSELLIRDERHSTQITASFGVVEIEHDVDINEALERVDQALYQAKNNGRNRVEVWREND